jgi:hypothetical protein
MRTKGKAVLALISTFALASAAVAAGAKEEFHNLMIALPDGSVQHIRYTGDVAPQIVILPASSQLAPGGLFDAFDAPFAELDRVVADMNRQSDAMLRQAAMLSARAADGRAGLNQAVITDMPAGTVSYSFFSTTGGNGSCSQSLQVTSYGASQKPKVVSQSSGDCSKMMPKLVPTTGARPSSSMPKLVPVKLETAPAPARPANPA